MVYYIVVLGTAGSGKTTLTSSLQDYLLNNGMSASIVNLDPAVDELPYKPDIDVREYVNARELMKMYGLGPNGSLIAAVDMLALQVEELRDEVWSLKSNYIIVDTPGQMEIFAFRESGPLIIDSIIGTSKAVALFLVDAVYASRPSNYFSALLLSASTYVRIGLPQLNVITKVDIVSENILEKIIRYSEDLSIFAEEIVKDRSTALIWGKEEILSILENIYFSDTIPVSATQMIGLDQLYAAIQRIVAGGEDYLTEEPSERL